MIMMMMITMTIMILISMIGYDHNHDDDDDDNDDGVAGSDLDMAQKHLLIKTSVKKSFFSLSYIRFFAPSQINLGAQSKSMRNVEL